MTINYNSTASLNDEYDEVEYDRRRRIIELYGHPEYLGTNLQNLERILTNLFGIRGQISVLIPIGDEHYCWQFFSKDHRYAWYSDDTGDDTFDPDDFSRERLKRFVHSKEVVRPSSLEYRDGETLIRLGRWRNAPLNPLQTAQVIDIAQRTSEEWHLTNLNTDVYLRYIRRTLSIDHRISPLDWAKRHAELVCGLAAKFAQKDGPPSFIIDTCTAVAPLVCNAVGAPPVTLYSQSSQEQQDLQYFLSQFPDTTHGEIATLVLELGIDIHHPLSGAFQQFCTDLPVLLENGIHIQEVMRCIHKKPSGYSDDDIYTFFSSIFGGTPPPWWFDEYTPFSTLLPTDPQLGLHIAQDVRYHFEFFIGILSENGTLPLSQVSGIDEQRGYGWTREIVTLYGIGNVHRAAKIIQMLIGELEKLSIENRMSAGECFMKHIRAQAPESIMIGILEGDDAYLAFPGLPSLIAGTIEKKDEPINAVGITTTMIEELVHKMRRPLVERNDVRADLAIGTTSLPLLQSLGMQAKLGMQTEPGKEGSLRQSDSSTSCVTTDTTPTIAIMQLYARISEACPHLSPHDLNTLISIYFAFCAPRLPEPLNPPVELFTFLRRYINIPHPEHQYSFFDHPSNRGHREAKNNDCTKEKYELIAWLIDLYTIGYWSWEQCFSMLSILAEEPKKDDITTMQVDIQREEVERIRECRQHDRTKRNAIIQGERRLLLAKMCAVLEENISTSSVRHSCQLDDQNQIECTTIPSAQRIENMKRMQELLTEWHDPDFGKRTQYLENEVIEQNLPQPLSPNQRRKERKLRHSHTAKSRVLTACKERSQEAMTRLIRSQKIAEKILPLCQKNILPQDLYFLLVGRLIEKHDEETMIENMSNDDRQWKAVSVFSIDEFEVAYTALVGNNTTIQQQFVQHLQSLNGIDDVTNLFATLNVMTEVYNTLSRFTNNRIARVLECTSDHTLPNIDQEIRQIQHEIFQKYPWLPPRCIFQFFDNIRKPFILCHRSLSMLARCQIDESNKMTTLIQRAVVVYTLSNNQNSTLLETESSSDIDADQSQVLALHNQSDIDAMQAMIDTASDSLSSLREGYIGLFPIGAKVHVMDTEKIDATIYYFAEILLYLKRPGFKLLHADTCITLPPMCTPDELLLMLNTLEKMGLLNVQYPELQLCIGGRLPEPLCAILGSTIFLATECNPHLTSDTMKTSHESKIGIYIMAYDDGVLESDLPFLTPETKGRTDMLCRRSPADAVIYQLVGTVLQHVHQKTVAASQGKDTSMYVFADIGEEFMKRHSVIMEKHGLSSTLNAPWIRAVKKWGQNDEEEVDRQAKHMRDAILPCMATYRECAESMQTNPTEHGIIHDMRELVDWLSSSIKPIQATLHEHPSFAKSCELIKNL